MWSGIWGSDGGWTGPNDPTNDYSQITTLNVGCVGPSGDLWFTDCRHANVLNDLLGALHLPALPSGDTVWIGNRIGRGRLVSDPETGDVCGCTLSDPFCFYFTGNFAEDSPRSTGAAETGAILLATSASLEGQVVITERCVNP